MVFCVWLLKDSMFSGCGHVIMCIPHSPCPFIIGWAPGCFHFRALTNNAARACSPFSVDTGSHFSWADTWEWNCWVIADLDEHFGETWIAFHVASLFLPPFSFYSPPELIWWLKPVSSLPALWAGWQGAARLWELLSCVLFPFISGSSWDRAGYSHGTALNPEGQQIENTPTHTADPWKNWQPRICLSDFSPSPIASVILHGRAGQRRGSEPGTLVGF